MGIQIGDKYIIEIGAIAELPNGKKKYFIKPFESLVFDRKGLEQLEKCDKAWEEKLDKQRKQAYDKGYYDGYDKCLHSSANDDYEKGELDVLEEFENLFINVCAYNQFFEDTYGSKDPGLNLYELVAKYGAKKIIDDFKKWEEKEKAEIKVGDEVITSNSNIAIITFIDDEYVTIIFHDGSSGTFNKETLRKTGKHFDEVEQLLGRLRGEEE